MKLHYLILAIVFAFSQTDEVKLDAVQPRITTVSAMRVRKAPQVTAEEVVRLKLGTIVNAIARSTNQDTIGGKTDYWYRVNLPNNKLAGSSVVCCSTTTQVNVKTSCARSSKPV